MLVRTWATITTDAGLQTGVGVITPKLGAGGGVISGFGLVAAGFSLLGSVEGLTPSNNIVTTLAEPEVTTLGDNIIHTGS